MVCIGIRTHYNVKIMTILINKIIINLSSLGIQLKKQITPAHTT